MTSGANGRVYKVDKKAPLKRQKNKKKAEDGINEELAFRKVVCSVFFFVMFVRALVKRGKRKKG